MQSVRRLISEFIPESYNLSIVISEDSKSFSGTLTMIGHSVNGLVALHAKELTIDSASVDGKKATVDTLTNDEVELRHDNLKPGQHTVTIGYHGIITSTLHGLYPCRFTHEGVDKQLLVTQFESHYAREVLPCIDEPEAKATFDVTVTTKPNITVLGNMPVLRQAVDGDKMTTSFQTTPRMSTYLLALVMGELQSKTRKTKDGVEVSVWSTPVHPLSQLDVALDEAVKSIEFFNDYFGVPYPLPKADHVAIPDFDAGAMENWGLITYREAALLADESSSLPSRQYISTVISHELSHQWFGNLVTMKWWNNLWLNESFASIMEFVAPNAIHPDWDLWLDFSTNDGVVATRRDAIDGVQAVQTDVNHPDEINSIFDGAIVYAKGARLMRMLQQTVGEDTFREALGVYFSRFAYKNTDENDLWDAMSTASKQDIGEFMNTWISQSGFPVVTAQIANGQLHLSQKQFFVGEHSASNKLWPIPLGANHETVPALLAEKQISIAFESGDYLTLNSKDSAHFITNYDETLLKRLVDAVASGKLDEIGRIKLIHERVMLARSGEVSPSSLIDLLEAYSTEENEQVWSAIGLALGELRKYIEQDTEAESMLRELVGRLSKHNYERLGWEFTDSDSINDTKLRPQMIANMIYAEDKSVIDEAIRRAHSDKLELLNPELRSILLSASVRYGDDEAFIEQLIERYAHEVSPDLKSDIRSALTSTRDKTLIARLLALLTDTDVIRTQDTAYWFIYTLSNRHGRTLAWNWMRENWGWIEETFGSDKSYDNFPRYTGQILMTRAELAEYDTFFKPMIVNVGLKRAIEMGMTDLSGRVALIEKFSDGVCTRLKQL